MYDLAVTVTACLRAGTRVELAWLVDVRGLTYTDRGDALAITPGGGQVGSVLAGGLNDQLVSLAALQTTGRLIEVPINEFEAMLAGLSGQGIARCVIMAATELPDELWPLLRAREPVCLVTALEGDRTAKTAMYTAATITGAGEDIARLFARGASAVQVLDGAVVTALWPVPRLFLVGGGPIVDALESTARLVGWSVAQRSDDFRELAGLTAADGVVVGAHDLDLAGAALLAALRGGAGYIGALGSPAMRQARTGWLADREVTDLSRVHSPAGLTIAARTPAEIAVAIVAEMLSVRPS